MAIAVLLSLAAFLVAAAGFYFAPKVGKPGRFKMAGIIAAAGLVLLWLLPWWVISQNDHGLQMPLMIAALVIAISTLGVGLTQMATAATGKAETEVDRIIHNFDPYDDSP